MSASNVITLGYGSFSTVNFLPTLGYGATVPAPAVVKPTPTTIGGIGRWTIEIPRLPKKKVYDYRRNMENQDRADIEAILNMLEKGGFL